ncbi:helix-turn-helix transcriptional regulator [Candidatus Vondammii sp. HM_W22]|uniref:helix-turn-helix transcriptional regulator n=1 Tax=Candidatus Vondammii sp. HM_W22 TaxID=2687299 RepID=UPI001F138B8D|nr:AlpA family phage regulatory protein [Candidatus Vondammii sp. HM_W22]
MAGLSRTTLWRLESKGEFPRRVSLGGNSVGWKLSEIKQWIDERLEKIYCVYILVYIFKLETQKT